MPTFALLPAAGHSQRMGRPKLALPLGNQTVLEHILHTLRHANIEKILVVLAPHVSFLASLAEQAGAHVLVLPAETPHMRTTLEKGLDWIEQTWRPAPTDHWLLCPADHPVLDPAVITALQLALTEQPQKTIALPVHDNQRGHPALIAWAHVRQLHTFPLDLGLNTYLRQYPEQTLELPWPTPDILTDLDTPEDYQRLLEKKPFADGPV